MIDVPYFINSYMAHLLDMVFGTCLATGGPAAAKFLVLELGVLAALGAYVAGRRLFHAEAGVWAALLFYATPVVIWSSGTTYLDLPQALFITAAALAFINWYETSSWGWMAVSGWICGVATGTKTAAIGTLIALPLLGVVHAFGRRSLALLWPAVVFIALTILVFAPWHAVIYAWTGNPFFPMFNKVFQSPHFPLENTNLDWGQFGIGTSWSALIRLPFWFTLDTVRFGSVRGAVGLAPLLLFPLAARYLFKGTFQQRAFLALIGLHALSWTFSAQIARYWVPILPLALTVGCAVFLERSSGAAVRFNRVALGLLALAQLPLASVLFWNIPERYPLEYAFGLETQDSFLERTIVGYGAARYLNPKLKPGEKILEAGLAQSRYYFDAPLYNWLTTSGVSGSESEINAAIRQRGFAYIVAAHALIKEPPQEIGYLQPAYLKRFAEEIYRDGSVVLFRVRPADSSVATP
jgi:4-amino-4-deoxy-L-arabinose transferase-like glycosyltransferase